MRCAILVTNLSLLACAGRTMAPEMPASQPLGASIWTDPAGVEARCQTGLDEAARLRAALAAGAPDPLAAYNGMLLAIDHVFGLMSLLGNVHPEKPVREAAEACERKVQSLINDINLDRGLYDAMVAVDLAGQDAETARFAEKLLRAFRRAGVDKDEATRTELKALHAEMVEVGQSFARTIREDVRKIAVDPQALDGLPADWIAAHAPNAEGKVEITTNYPDFFPVQEYAKSEALRRELTIAFLARGYPENDAGLKKLLGLRKRYAALLGYESWAAYNAEDKMVKSADRIAKFLDDITAIARPRSERELEELLARKRKDVPEAAAVESWDRFYYVNKVREEKYGFEGQSVRPYFEFGAVTAGLMELYGELFGLRFAKDEGASRWHDSVLAYDVFSGDEKIARFYLDMHPRDGKYGHAAMFPIETGLAGGGIPMAALVCNFPDPSKGPALMEHNQVVTYFHEFGHLVHHLLARGSRWVSLAGINVEWDFVEAPSQLLEEWAWDPAVLARFAKHVETKATIPAEVVAKMRASSELGKGVHVMRQLFFSALSFELHAVDPAGVDLLAFQRKLEEKYMPYPYVEGTYTYAGFGHIEGYSSMYYTYQWSLVLAKDIFTRFAKAGLLDAATARDYRERILAPGGAKDANELVRGFLGREPSLEAYRAWLEAD